MTQSIFSGVTEYMAPTMRWLQTQSLSLCPSLIPSNKFIMRVSPFPQVSPGLWLKMKRQEAVEKAFGLTATKPAATAQQVNTATLQWALNAVSPQARERYEKYGA